MIAYEKLCEIFNAEKININVNPGISWLAVESILKDRRLQKYSVWLTTGKITPEAGQISPAIAHNGLMKII
ncbi:hypothetical protein AB7X03_14310 [Providencia rettgeri]